MQLKNIKDIAETISYIIVIIGSFFAIYQYIDMLHQDKVKETLSYESRLNSDKYLEAKSTIAKAWLPQEKFFKELQIRGVKSTKDKDKILELISTNVIEKNSLNNNIDLLCDFYDSLNICLEQNICDKKSTINFFTPYANRFFKLHKSYILTRREFIDNYCNGLENLINLKEK